VLGDALDHDALPRPRTRAATSNPDAGNSADSAVRDDYRRDAW
jgi:hypothetical protein